MKQRLYYIDAIKGFMMILVVIGHILDGYLNAGMFLESSHQMWIAYNFIYSFHMPCFFIVSGFLFEMTFGNKDLENESNKRHLHCQIERLGYVYLIWSLFMGMFKLCLSRYANTKIRIIDLFCIPIKPIKPYWYLYVLIIYYIVLSRNKIKQLSKKKLLLSAVGLSVFSKIIPYIDLLSLSDLLYHFLYFVIGTLIFDYYNRFLHGSTIKMGGMATISLVLFFIFWNESISAIPIIDIIVALSLSWLVWNVFLKLKFSEDSILVFLGEHTLEIYVIHCFITSSNRMILSMLKITHPIIAITMNLIFSIVISLGIAYGSKRIGVYKYLFGTKKK